MAGPRITRAYGAVNIGSFRISAMIMGQDENGSMVVLGSSHRKSEGVKRGYVTEMRAASLAIRQALEKAEASAGTPARATARVRCFRGQRTSWKSASDSEKRSGERDWFMANRLSSDRQPVTHDPGCQGLYMVWVGRSELREPAR